jgi:hypothetical protein
MSRLTYLRSGERGAVALMVAMLFGFGVMFGAGALTIDVGNINADRRQLQNGSDAVALSAARDCALGACPSVLSSTDMAPLNSLANSNAADGRTKISRVDLQTPAGQVAGTPAICGVGPGLFACPSSAAPDSAKLQECPTEGLPAKYVRVYTQTQNASGQTILPYSFGAAIAGAGSGANQQSCAAVGWGPLKTAAALPITFSYCEWQAQTGAVPPNNPGSYYPAPTGNPAGYGGTGQPAYPPASTERVLLTAKNVTACSTWNGHNAPGGFGGVDEGTSTICSATVPANGWLQTDPGNNAPCTGDTPTLANLVGTVVYLPIFDCMTNSPVTITAGTDCASGNGNNLYYHVTGFAAFFISGYFFSGDKVKSLLTGNYPCSGSDRCLSGWFVHKLIPTGDLDLSGAPDLGTTVMKILG